MCKRLSVIIAVIVAMGTVWIQARDAVAAKAATLTAVISASSVPSPVAGTCANSGYAAVCPGGTCGCVSIPNATVTGNLGKGTVDLELTEDAALATTSDPVTCTPFFGTATITVPAIKKNPGNSETLNLVGAYCGTQGISGGFGVAASPAPSPALTGFGSMSGTVSSKNALKITLRGPIS
jgi:hypothetical protein